MYSGLIELNYVTTANYFECTENWAKFKIMKKLIFLLLFSILFQSCFSYKSVDFKSNSIEKKQKFKVTKLDRTNIKGRLVSKNEKTMILENNEGLQTILKDEIYDMKVRKFAILKSFGVVAGAAVLTALFATLIGYGYGN